MNVDRKDQERLLRRIVRRYGGHSVALLHGGNVDVGWDNGGGVMVSMRELLGAAGAVLAAGPRVRHRVRGGSYVELGRGELQVSAGGPLEEGEELVAYRSEEDGKLWFRRPAEFDDRARFERLPDAE